MQLIVASDGVVRGLYDEAIDLAALGRPAISRASHVECDEQGHWRAALTPVNGPILGPFSLRSEALNAERQWLLCHWLESGR